eukprot:Amastigsp_a508544_235.p2 type:complete len:107 gc:universal Amastigsp_a508544_235:1363-1683(+)
MRYQRRFQFLRKWPRLVKYPSLSGGMASTIGRRRIRFASALSPGHASRTVAGFSVGSSMRIKVSVCSKSAYSDSSPPSFFLSYAILRTLAASKSSFTGIVRNDPSG